MIIKSFCWCCGKDTDVYINKNTGWKSRHCIECKENYPSATRNQMETKLVVDIMFSQSENQGESNQ